MKVEALTIFQSLPITILKFWNLLVKILPEKDFWILQEEPLKQ